MSAHNPLLEARLENLRESLDEISAAVDENLRTVLRRLTCDQSVSGSGELLDIDALGRGARERCLLLVAREHPMASDLKYAMAALRVEHDYERIQELAQTLYKRAERLTGTPMQDIVQEMTGVMADILKLHEVVRHTWQRERKDHSLPNLKPRVQYLAAGVQLGVSGIQQRILETISRGSGSPEMAVELVLACRHLKRIASLMESIPDELHSFDKPEAACGGEALPG
jgi:phosphate transport system protein